MGTEITGCAAPIVPPPGTSPPAIVRSASARLERGHYSWIWVVSSCPYCGHPHEHYGRPLDHDPYHYLGQLFPARCDRAARRQLLIHQPDAALWYVLEADP